MPKPAGVPLKKRAGPPHEKILAYETLVFLIFFAKRLFLKEALLTQIVSSLRTPARGCGNPEFIDKTGTIHLGVNIMSKKILLSLVALTLSEACSASSQELKNKTPSQAATMTNESLLDLGLISYGTNID